MRNELTVKVSDAMRGRELTINLRLVKDWRFRVGFWFIRLGGRIMGLAVKEQTP